MSTRRQFLALGTAAAAATALPSTLLAQYPSEVFSNANLGAYTQGLLTADHFQSQVGSVFRAFLPDRSVEELTLLSVLDMTPDSAAVTAQKSVRGQVALPVRGVAARSASSAFHVSFAVSGPALAQESYTLDHGTLGRFAVFLVPGVSSTGGNTCGASFNYLSTFATLPVAPQPRTPISIQQQGQPVAVAGPQSLSTVQSLAAKLR